MSNLEQCGFKIASLCTRSVQLVAHSIKSWCTLHTYSRVCICSTPHTWLQMIHSVLTKQLFGNLGHFFAHFAEDNIQINEQSPVNTSRNLKLEGNEEREREKSGGAAAGVSLPVTCSSPALAVSAQCIRVHSDASIFCPEYAQFDMFVF